MMQIRDEICDFLRAEAMTGFLKCDIPDSGSPSNLCTERHRHFCARLICREYAFQLGSVAHNTYVSKMRGSRVIIEMVMGRGSKKGRQTTLFSSAWLRSV